MTIFLPVHPNLTPQKVDDAQLALDRDVDNVDVIIHDPVAEPH